MKILNKALRAFLAVLAALQLSGCMESSFTLAEESRLPKWFEVPDGMTRKELKVTMDYYINSDGREAVFKLYANDSFFKVNKVTGTSRGLYPIMLKNQPDGFPKGYPSYEVITVNDVTDIIEHRKMEPIFYVTDDPAIWQELGVKH